MSAPGQGKLSVILGFVLSLLVSATRKKPANENNNKVAARTATSGANQTRDLETRFHRKLSPSYAPQLDGDADPGEVIWTWVPYAENDGRGKDRPVLIIAQLDNGDVAGCALSTKDHRGYLPVGSGKWDSTGRASYLNTNRLLRVPQNSMRREGHVLPQEKFETVVKHLAQRYGFTR